MFPSTKLFLEKVNILCHHETGVFKIQAIRKHHASRYKKEAACEVTTAHLAADDQCCGI